MLYDDVLGRGFIVMSAQLGTCYAHRNHERHIELYTELRDVYTSSVLTEIIGTYGGVLEKSWKVKLGRDFSKINPASLDDLDDELLDLVDLAKKYGQESILYVNDYGDGFLIYIDEDVDHQIVNIGSLQLLADLECHSDASIERDLTAWTVS